MAGRAIARGARGVDPVCFAMVMATGIVSAALRQAAARSVCGAARRRGGGLRDPRGRVVLAGGGASG